MNITIQGRFHRQDLSLRYCAMILEAELHAPQVKIEDASASKAGICLSKPHHTCLQYTALNGLYASRPRREMAIQSLW